MISEPPQDYLDYIKFIAKAERDGIAAMGTIVVGPFTAFTMISALQLTLRHPELNWAMKTRIRSIIDQMKPWFVYTPAEEVINMGDHPEWDVSPTANPMIFNRAGGGIVAIMCEECSMLGGHTTDCPMAGGEDSSG